MTPSKLDDIEHAIEKQPLLHSSKFVNERARELGWIV